MKCLLTKALFLALTAFMAESKLVVYGPQELIDKFNSKIDTEISGDKAKSGKNKSKSVR